MTPDFFKLARAFVYHSSRYIQRKVAFVEAYHFRNGDLKSHQRNKSDMFQDLDQIGTVLTSVSTDIPLPFVAYITRSVEAYNQLLDETRTTSTEFQKLSYKMVEAPKADLV